jgi:hypothetical protein
MLKNRRSVPGPGPGSVPGSGSGLWQATALGQASVPELVQELAKARVLGWVGLAEGVLIPMLPAQALVRARFPHYRYWPLALELSWGRLMNRHLHRRHRRLIRQEIMH